MLNKFIIMITNENFWDPNFLHDPSYEDINN